jgi:hypothetical protein
MLWAKRRGKSDGTNRQRHLFQQQQNYALYPKCSWLKTILKIELRNKTKCLHNVFAPLSMSAVITPELFSTTGPEFVCSQLSVDSTKP